MQISYEFVVLVLEFAESFTEEGINTNALGNLNFNHFLINN